MKRKLTLCIIFIMCMGTIFSSSAFADCEESADSVYVTAESGIQPRAEETEWYWRENNGIIEKRLWSITYGKWLTDWIYVGPAP